MSNDDSTRKQVFLVIFAILALCINGVKRESDSQEQSSAIASQAEAKSQANAAQQAQNFAQKKAQQEAQERESQRQLAIDREAAARKAVADAIVAHAEFLARYLNPGLSQKSGVENIALAVASDGAETVPALDDALVRRFKNPTIDINPGVFKPAFIADNLFAEVFNGETNLIGQLELSRSLDGLLLARETVQYSNNPDLANVMTAHAEIQIKLLSIGGNGQNQTWSFSADGPGFGKTDALAIANERIIKQITNDTSMSLAQITTGN